MFNKSNSAAEARLDALTREYQAELDKRGLPQMSADELLHEDLGPDDRRYVSDFYDRWNLVENAMAEERAALAKAEAEAFTVAVEGASVLGAIEREEDDVDWDEESERNADASYADPLDDFNYVGSRHHY